MSEGYSYLCIGGPASGQYFASPNPYTLRVAVAPPMTATFIETDLSAVVAGPTMTNFEYTARKLTILGKVKTLWTDPAQSDWHVIDGLKFYLFEKFVNGEIR